MPAEKNALPPQEADERLSRELLLRYMAAKAARPPLASLLATLSQDTRVELDLKTQPPAHDVRFPP
jgi:hypothetical protein